MTERFAEPSAVWITSHHPDAQPFDLHGVTRIEANRHGITFTYRDEHSFGYVEHVPPGRLQRIHIGHVAHQGSIMLEPAR